MAMKLVRMLQRVRTVCLGFPETTETGSWGHPTFRAGEKAFAALENVDGRPSIAFKLRACDVPAAARKAIFATPYGRGLWVSVWAETSLDWRTVGDMLELSYRATANRRMLKALDVARAATRAGRATKPVKPERP